MKTFPRLFLLWITVLVLSACHIAGPGDPRLAATSPHPLLNIPVLTPTIESGEQGQAEIATLASLNRVDEYPLFTMHSYIDYTQIIPDQSSTLLPAEDQTEDWACSLFATLADPDERLFGRNFDWRYSPALLLFNHPPDGYESVSMVDLAYLIEADKLDDLEKLELSERQALLEAPLWPFDGMNDAGLVIGMAAVPPGNVKPDPAKETVDSLMVMRMILDEAANVDQAVSILRQYNIQFGGGPPLHYLIADRTGRAVLVEFSQGEIVTIPKETGWHAATNFLLSEAGNDPTGRCSRYDQLSTRLIERQGKLHINEAMQLLAQVAQDNTQWSVVYGLNSGEVSIVMGGEYDRVHTFKLSDWQFEPE